MLEQTAETDRALYLFCFARAGAQPDQADQDHLFSYRFGELIAICEWTGMQEWSEPQSQQRMQDLEWLAPKAIRHQAVIEAAMRGSPVLPARLGTLFSSPDAIDRFFAIHHATIASFLADVDGKEEWALKGVLDRPRAGEWLASAMNGSQAGSMPPGGGASYLRERRAHAAASRDVSRWAAQCWRRLWTNCTATRRTPVSAVRSRRPPPARRNRFLTWRFWWRGKIWTASADASSAPRRNTKAAAWS
jgi:hypothetical protein